jgi:hypothetical protein
VVDSPGAFKVNLIDFPEAHIVVAEKQPEYLPMPAYVYDDQVITCCWKLTWRERFAVLLGGRIWHSVWCFGRALQPQRLDVFKPSMPMDESRHYQREKRKFIILGGTDGNRNPPT